MTENEKRFLEGLEVLTKETGVVVGGCGCCGSPYLTCTDSKPDKNMNGKYTYTLNQNWVESLSWEEK